MPHKVILQKDNQNFEICREIKLTLRQSINIMSQFHFTQLPQPS